MQMNIQTVIKLYYCIKIVLKCWCGGFGTFRGKGSFCHNIRWDVRPFSKCRAFILTCTSQASGHGFADGADGARQTGAMQAEERRRQGARSWENPGTSQVTGAEKLLPSTSTSTWLNEGACQEVALVSIASRSKGDAAPVANGLVGLHFDDVTGPLLQRSPRSSCNLWTDVSVRKEQLGRCRTFAQARRL